ncbi:carbohydrate ABC transporter permease [Rugosimonospora africana]|uniref:Sugar ABC transporter permease n=1 Tax=Rugosimonospora africana TaxID=556532 RepID=A0A8J3QW83_9ACTN|nr:sugar ABC transporter permease [Rugosimonospora africana]GIH17519.1 sugar ABC transporter permease [Rugosimonospora africana]
MALTTASPRTPGDQTPDRAPAARRRGRASWRTRERSAGYVFLTPWLLGLLGVTAAPTLYSLYLSFTNYDLFTTPQWVGLHNYQRMFTNDPQFWHAVRVTVLYAVVAVPLKLAAALGVALLLVRERRGIGWIRALFYLPSLLGGSVALAIVWQAMFGGTGAVNHALSLFGIHGKAWVNDPDTALGTLVLLGAWQFGAPMVIFLAGLKQIPNELYEAAAVDGAGAWRSFWRITLPMLSPVLFFNLVLEVIHAFQTFTPAYVISNGLGGPVDSTMVYTLYLYLRGWSDFEMGYASALAWVFLAVVGLLTAVLFSTGRLWVHYSDGED